MTQIGIEPTKVLNESQAAHAIRATAPNPRRGGRGLRVAEPRSRLDVRPGSAASIGAGTVSRTRFS